MCFSLCIIFAAFCSKFLLVLFVIKFDLRLVKVRKSLCKTFLWEAHDISAKFVSHVTILD